MNPNSTQLIMEIVRACNHRMEPRVNCDAGADLEGILRQVAFGRISGLAPRSCYAYNAGPGPPLDCLRARGCPSQLPAGGMMLQHCTQRT